LAPETFPGLVLGIETSCDETSAALLRGREVLTNVVSSQADLHARWGGVVPEVASRMHVEAIVPVLTEALDGARPDAVSVTDRPGLVGALSVGVTAAKALAASRGLPLIGVHHIEAHILSASLAEPDLPWPHLCLVVSGGHTELVWVEAPGRMRLVGQTVDDAAGEAFDKGARLLGLGYPGGAKVQATAASGRPGRYRLPRADVPGYDFSFSGLKTAVLRLVERESDGLDVPSAAHALQEAVVEALAATAERALVETGAEALTLVGGVAANQPLRDRLAGIAGRSGRRFVAPPLTLCTDNAAMIAYAGSLRLAAGERHGLDLDPRATAPLPGA
jgi:N6-L-threonylcarbamoyladenine synthase